MRSWTKEIHSNLVWEICKSPGVAAFDFDNTLISNDFGEAVMNSLVSDGMKELKHDFTDFFRPEIKVKASRAWKLKERNPILFKNFIWNEYKFLMKNEGVEKAYRWTSFLFSGWKEKKFRAYAKKVWKSEYKKKDSTAIRPYKEMLGLIRFLKENNWKVFIVTASPQSIIQEISHIFYVPEENVIGMKFLEEEGISTSEIKEPYTYGEGKVKAFYNQTGFYPDLAFGDSENDLPLMKSATRFGILIDKGNPDLVKKCKDAKCLIQPVFQRA